MYKKQFEIELDAALADSDDLTTGTPAESGRSVMESLGLSSPYLGETITYIIDLLLISFVLY